MDQVIKKMCHNMIGQSKKIFLKSQIISHKKIVLIIMTQKKLHGTIMWKPYLKNSSKYIGK